MRLFIKLWMQSLISECWDADAARRPTVDDVIERFDMTECGGNVAADRAVKDLLEPNHALASKSKREPSCASKAAAEASHCTTPTPVQPGAQQPQRETTKKDFGDERRTRTSRTTR